MCASGFREILFFVHVNAAVCTHAKRTEDVTALNQ